MNQLKWLGFCGVLSLIACGSSSNDGDNGGKLSGSGASAGAAGAATGGGGNAGAGVGGVSAAGAAGAGNTAAVGGTGAVSADAGADGSNCDLLFSDYTAAVSAAGECTPGAPSQCGLLVQSNPGCGEYTLVQETNTDAIADIDNLKSQWTASGCSVSCGLGGHGATEAICEPYGGTGYCKVTKY